MGAQYPAAFRSAAAAAR
jgi:hypothetical protein